MFILVPRTGSGTLYRELLRVYPRSMLLYRHMEADGVPFGYTRWERIGFARSPLNRLWSLYNFMATFNGGAQNKQQGDIPRVHAQTQRPFEDWLLNNMEPWTVPFSFYGEERYQPILARLNTIPENRASQFDWLRPDLGTTVLQFTDLQSHMASWGLNPAFRANNIPSLPPPTSAAITAHLEKFQAWDLEHTNEEA